MSSPPLPAWVTPDPNPKKTVDIDGGHKSLKIWLVISFLVLLFGGIFCYIRRQLQRRVQQGDQQMHAELAQNIPENVQGIPTEIVAALPRRIYQGAEEDMECSICLEVFQDGEELPELPSCRHLFHAECIGSHFRGRRDCPNCRALASAET